MAGTIEKKINFLGRNIFLTIPNHQSFCSSEKDYSDSFDLSDDLTLKINVRKTLDINLIITRIVTTYGIEISKYESGLVSTDELFDKLESEIEEIVENIERDTSTSQKKHRQIAETLSNVMEGIRKESERNAIHNKPKL